MRCDGDAAVGGGFGGFNGEGRGEGEVVDPVHELFAALGRDGLEDFAAADGDEEEEAPAHDAEVFEELVDGGEIVDGLLGDEGVDLDGHAEGGGGAGGDEGGVEAAGDTADGFVARGGGAIEGEAEAFDAAGFQFGEDGWGEGVGGAGGDGDGEAEGAGFVDDAV
jgi:hypothetical protein